MFGEDEFDNSHQFSKVDDSKWWNSNIKTDDYCSNFNLKLRLSLKNNLPTLSVQKAAEG